MLEFRSAALIGSLNLLSGFLIFALVGYSLMVLLGGRWLQKLRPTGMIVAFVVGQLGLTTLYYLRSLLSHTCRKVFGVSLPITPPELWGVALALGLVSVVTLYRGYRSATRNERSTLVRALGLEIAAFWLMLLGISLMELPREIMLSSDPDLHAFWAHQVSRMSEVPWNQGVWGPDRFSYPTGFAVLNYVWSVFSGLTIEGIVTTQPLIQTQLSMALLAWTACYLGRGRDNASSRTGYIGLFLSLMVVYYVLLPFGYQHSHLHLEGTGRLSATLLAATCLSFGLIFLMSLWREAISIGDASRYLLFCGCVATLIALINPAAVMIPSCFVGISALAYLVIGRQPSPIYRPIALVGLVLPLIQLLFADPYYFDIFAGGSEAASSHNAAVPSGQNLIASLATNTRTVLSDPLSAVWNFFTLDLLTPEATWRVFSLVAVAYVVLSVCRWIQSKRFEAVDLILLGLITFEWLAYSLIFLPTAGSLASHPRGALLYPYLIQSLQQNMFILLSFGVAIILTRMTLLSRWWVTLIVVVALVKPMASLSASSAMVTVKPRYGYSGSMGDLTADDRRVLDYIGIFSQQIRAKYPDLNAQRSPKILIPNDAIVLNQERWLFSFGGSRVLPFRDTLPVAFYYSQGDARQFSWDAYKQNVCQGLNRGWMATRNIRYVFIPSQIAGDCSVALRRSVRREDILFQSGDALFAKIL